MNRSITMLALCAALAGCSIYSPTRDKQTQELRAAYAKVDVGAQITAARQNRKTLLEQQMAVVDTLSKAKAQNLAWGMAAAENRQGGNQGTVAGALAALAGTVNAADWTESEEARRQRTLIATTNQKALDARGADFKRYGIPFPACEDVVAESKTYQQLKARAKEPKEFADRMLQQRLPDVEAICAPVKDYQGAYNKAAGPEALAAAWGKLEQERAAVKRLTADVNAAKAALQQGLADMGRQKENCRNAQQPACLAELKKLAAEAAAKLEKFAGNPFVTDYLSEEKRQAIDEFLSFVSDYDPSKPIPDKAPRAALVLVFFPEVIDSVKQKSDGVEKSAWAALAMQKSVAAIQTEVARKEIAIRQQKMLLLEQQLDLFQQRVDRFTEAGQMAAALAPGTREAQLADVLDNDSKAKLNERTAVMRALAYYIDGATRLDAEAAKRELQLLALDSEIALGYSEANINQWAVLVGANVASLEAAAQSGIRPETINALINSVFLMWIGAGVN